MSSLRVLVVDDEMPARQRLEYLLARQPRVELVGSCASAHEAIRTLGAVPVDVVFLDVQMPELTGLDVVRRVGPERMPATVFVTAYDRYALQAFKIAALDYLLKPFDDERFEQALARAREWVRLRQMDRLTSQLQSLLGDAASDPALYARAEAGTCLDRIAVDARGERLLISTHQIDYIAAEGAYARLHNGGETYLIRERMQRLEENLDPHRFCRIHRSTIVNVERIAALEPLFRGDHIVKLRDRTRLRLSRTHREALGRRLGVVI